MHSLLAGVKHPSRYIGREWGSGTPKESTSEMVRVCYAFPDLYEVGMSYLGYQILYELTKSLPYADAERVYTPWPDMEAALRRSNTHIWALESGHSPASFEVVGFSLQYELSYTNVLTILDLSGIPLRSINRRDSDPIVIAGGTCASSPEPMAPFIDAFCIGDGEVLVPEVLSALSALKRRPRSEKLEALSKISGVYVPLINQKMPIVKRIAEDLDNTFYHADMIVPNTNIVHDRATVQVFKGCTRGCRFCQAGMIDRPLRERSAKSVIDQVEALIKNTGWDEVGLLSLSTCDWSGLEELLCELTPKLGKRNIKLSLPSLRMDAFSVNTAAKLEAVRRGGLTFAPEAGTQRLRDVINKRITDENIDAALEAAFSHGWDKVKLYFMMGLPTETKEDLVGIHEICNRAVSIAKRHKRRGSVNVSIAGFVPKAHTPFQWEPQLDRDSLRERGRWIKNNIRNRNVDISYHEPEQTYLEGVLARGDSKLADAIEEVWHRGERFDGWREHFNFDRWMDVFRDLDIDSDSYANRARSLDEKFPWDHIDMGVSREFLLQERTKALNGITTKDCREGCNACGWQGRTSLKECEDV